MLPQPAMASSAQLPAPAQHAHVQQTAQSQPAQQPQYGAATGAEEAGHGAGQLEEGSDGMSDDEGHGGKRGPTDSGDANNPKRLKKVVKDYKVGSVGVEVS